MLEIGTAAGAVGGAIAANLIPVIIDRFKQNWDTYWHGFGDIQQKQILAIQNFYIRYLSVTEQKFLLEIYDYGIIGDSYLSEDITQDPKTYDYNVKKLPLILRTNKDNTFPLVYDDYGFTASTSSTYYHTRLQSKKHIITEALQQILDLAISFDSYKTTQVDKKTKLYTPDHLVMDEIKKWAVVLSFKSEDYIIENKLLEIRITYLKEVGVILQQNKKFWAKLKEKVKHTAENLLDYLKPSNDLKTEEIVIDENAPSSKISKMVDILNVLQSKLEQEQKKLRYHEAVNIFKGLSNDIMKLENFHYKYLYSIFSSYKLPGFNQEGLCRRPDNLAKVTNIDLLKNGKLIIGRLIHNDEFASIANNLFFQEIQAAIIEQKAFKEIQKLEDKERIKGSLAKKVIDYKEIYKKELGNKDQIIALAIKRKDELHQEIIKSFSNSKTKKEAELEKLGKSKNPDKKVIQKLEIEISGYQDKINDENTSYETEMKELFTSEEELKRYKAIKLSDKVIGFAPIIEANMKAVKLWLDTLRLIKEFEGFSNFTANAILFANMTGINGLYGKFGFITKAALTQFEETFMTYKSALTEIDNIRLKTQNIITSAEKESIRKQHDQWEENVKQVGDIKAALEGIVNSVINNIRKSIQTIDKCTLEELQKETQEVIIDLLYSADLCTRGKIRELCLQKYNIDIYTLKPITKSIGNELDNSQYELKNKLEKQEIPDENPVSVPIEEHRPIDSKIVTQKQQIQTHLKGLINAMYDFTSTNVEYLLRVLTNQKLPQQFDIREMFSDGALKSNDCYRRIINSSLILQLRQILMGNGFKMFQLSEEKAKELGIEAKFLINQEQYKESQAIIIDKEKIDEPSFIQQVFLPECLNVIQIQPQGYPDAITIKGYQAWQSMLVYLTIIDKFTCSLEHCYELVETITNISDFILVSHVLNEVLSEWASHHQDFNKDLNKLKCAVKIYKDHIKSKTHNYPNWENNCIQAASIHAQLTREEHKLSDLINQLQKNQVFIEYSGKSLVDIKGDRPPEVMKANLREIHKFASRIIEKIGINEAKLQVVVKSVSQIENKQEDAKMPKDENPKEENPKEEKLIIEKEQDQVNPEITATNYNVIRYRRNLPNAKMTEELIHKIAFFQAFKQGNYLLAHIYSGAGAEEKTVLDSKLGTSDRLGNNKHVEMLFKDETNWPDIFKNHCTINSDAFSSKRDKVLYEGLKRKPEILLNTLSRYFNRKFFDPLSHRERDELCEIIKQMYKRLDQKQQQQFSAKPFLHSDLSPSDQLKFNDITTKLYKELPLKDQELFSNHIRKTIIKKRIEKLKKGVIQHRDQNSFSILDQNPLVREEQTFIEFAINEYKKKDPENIEKSLILHLFMVKLPEDKYKEFHEKLKKKDNKMAELLESIWELSKDNKPHLFSLQNSLVDHLANITRNLKEKLDNPDFSDKIAQKLIGREKVVSNWLELSNLESYLVKALVSFENEELINKLNKMLENHIDKQEKYTTEMKRLNSTKEKITLLLSNTREKVIEFVFFNYYVPIQKVKEYIKVYEDAEIMEIKSTKVPNENFYSFSSKKEIAYGITDQKKYVQANQELFTQKLTDMKNKFNKAQTDAEKFKKELKEEKKRVETEQQKTKLAERKAELSEQQSKEMPLIVKQAVADGKSAEIPQILAKFDEEWKQKIKKELEEFQKTLEKDERTPEQKAMDDLKEKQNNPPKKDGNNNNHSHSK